jgi:hypothetical protein
MSDKLEAEYPEAAPFIKRAVRNHSEEWVIENYSPQITSLGVVMDVPPVEELPFYDAEQCDTLTEQQKRDRANAFREYRENLQNAGSGTE